MPEFTAMLRYKTSLAKREIDDGDPNIVTETLKAIFKGKLQMGNDTIKVTIPFESTKTNVEAFLADFGILKEGQIIKLTISSVSQDIKTSLEKFT